MIRKYYATASSDSKAGGIIMTVVIVIIIAMFLDAMFNKFRFFSYIGSGISTLIISLWR
jgi:hypothetical protein